ncbi:hypothetical protein BDZ89DRAFT_719352 [Hymenopellis radicata]|nr:hypothetical protein BDZ89DRAFT_719352 [Hymenopellis radicata]
MTSPGHLTSGPYRPPPSHARNLIASTSFVHSDGKHRSLESSPPQARRTSDSQAGKTFEFKRNNQILRNNMHRLEHEVNDLKVELNALKHEMNQRAIDQEGRDIDEHIELTDFRRTLEQAARNEVVGAIIKQFLPILDTMAAKRIELSPSTPFKRPQTSTSSAASDHLPMTPVSARKRRRLSCEQEEDSFTDDDVLMLSPCVGQEHFDNPQLDESHSSKQPQTSLAGTAGTASSSASSKKPSTPQLRKVAPRKCTAMLTGKREAVKAVRANRVEVFDRLETTAGRFQSVDKDAAHKEVEPLDLKGTRRVDDNLGNFEEGHIIDSGTLVWAKLSVVFEDCMPDIPPDILQKFIKTISKPQCIVMFFGHPKRKWAIVPLFNLKIFGDVPQLDQDMIAVKSHFQQQRGKRRVNKCYKPTNWLWMRWKRSRVSLWRCNSTLM